MSTDEEWAAAMTTIHEWRRRAKIAAHGHRLALKGGLWWHQFRGLVLVLLSVLLASSLMEGIDTFFPNHPGKIAFTKLVLALAVALLSAYQAYAASDQVAQKHDSLRAEYSSLCRDIEATLALPVLERTKLSAFITQVSDKLNTLSHSNFHIPESDYKRAKSEVAVEEPIAPIS